MAYDNTLESAVRENLKRIPWYRERSRKDMGHAHMIKRRIPGLEDVDPEAIRKAIHMNNSIDRAWRKILKAEPDLRGSDYDEKFHEEEQTLTNLGYGSTR